jgi:hypothetical protein
MKIDYLANLFKLMAADGVENRELLGLFEIEKRLHAKIDELVTAFNKAERDLSNDPPKFGLTVYRRRHLADLYALAHLDATVSALEQKLIDRFIEESGIPADELDRIRERGKQKADELIRDAINRITGRRCHGVPRVE